MSPGRRPHLPRPVRGRGLFLSIRGPAAPPGSLPPSGVTPSFPDAADLSPRPLQGSRPLPPSPPPSPGRELRFDFQVTCVDPAASARAGCRLRCAPARGCGGRSARLQRCGRSPSSATSPQGPQTRPSQALTILLVTVLRAVLGPEDALHAPESLPPAQGTSHERHLATRPPT